MFWFFVLIGTLLYTTQRCFNVHTTSTMLGWRRINVQITLCAYLEGLVRMVINLEFIIMAGSRNDLLKLSKSRFQNYQQFYNRQYCVPFFVSLTGRVVCSWLVVVVAWVAVGVGVVLSCRLFVRYWSCSFRVISISSPKQREHQKMS